MTREDTLQKAIEIVVDGREDEYGSPEYSFKLIADLWTTYLSAEVTPKDVANMMILLKIARTKGAYNPDNYIDMCGYAACANEVQSWSLSQTKIRKEYAAGSFHDEDAIKRLAAMERYKQKTKEE